MTKVQKARLAAITGKLSDAELLLDTLQEELTEALSECSEDTPKSEVLETELEILERAHEELVLALEILADLA